MALLLLAGALGGSVQSGSGRAVTSWFARDERGLALGVRQTAVPIGGLIAAVAIPLLGDPRSGFLFLSALVLFGAVVGALVLRSGAQHELETTDVESTLRDRRLWTVCAASGLYVVPQVALMGFVVLFLHDARGFSTASAAAVLAVSQALAAALRIGVGRWSDVIGSRVRPLRLIGVGVAIMLAVVAVTAMRDAWILVPAIAIATALSMAWNGLSFTIAAEIGGSRSGAAIGIQQTALAAAGILVPVGVRRRRLSDVLAGGVSRGGGVPARRLADVATARRPLGSPRARLRPARRALRDRRWAGREPPARVGCRGRGARACGGLARRGGPRRRGRQARQPRRSLEQREHDVWVGSHLDTVPQGGRFDGALGVVAAIEAVERVGAGTVVAFRGEEVGCIGSRALVAAGGPLPAAFLELHVEQGPRLADGALRSASSRRSSATHVRSSSSKDPPDTRARRPWKAAPTRSSPLPSEFCAIRDAALSIEDAVATVGEVDVEPGGGERDPVHVRDSRSTFERRTERGSMR